MKWSLFLAVLALAGRCSGEKPEPRPSERPPPAAPQAAVAARAESTSLVDALPRCDVEHAGLFIDLGTTSSDKRRDHIVGPFDDVAVSERSGATFASVHGKRLSYEFALTEPIQGAEVSLRALGSASRMVTIYVDERRLGTLALPREDPQVISTPPVDDLAAGTHTLTLRFSGAAIGADDAYAEIDWARIGPRLETPDSYAPPTFRDIVTDVVLGGEVRRSLVLRSPSRVRCAVRPSAGTKLETTVGYWGTGRGSAIVRVLEDGEKPVVAAERIVQGGTGAAWLPLSVDLSPFAGRVVGLEVGTGAAASGGRIAFGEPVVTKPALHGARSVSQARGVLVVVFSGLDRRTIPPWGSASTLSGVARLARDGVAFDRYRAPTTVVSAVMASLLAGVSPRAHGLEDPDSRIDDEMRLLGERAREASVHAAMFTGVPMSFPGFGLDRGWDRYQYFSPVKDLPATEPLSRALAWIREQAASGAAQKWLAVVHVRGGHPPWDVTRDEVALLPPEEYGGAIEPRGGAIALRNLRSGRTPVEQRLSADDWRRLHALEDAAMRQQDSSLRRLIETIDKEGLYSSSMVVFMGDVATGDPPGLPFAPVGPLREDVLLAPLIVKFPNGEMAGSQVDGMATTMDVTATILDALGLDGEGVEGMDLLRIAQGDVSLDGHAPIATLGSRYATRWGPWLLSGDAGHKPQLCLIEVDPACATDTFASSPLAAAALWQKTYDAEALAKSARRTRAPAVRPTFDPETQSALKVFGY